MSLNSILWTDFCLMTALMSVDCR